MTTRSSTDTNSDSALPLADKRTVDPATDPLESVAGNRDAATLPTADGSHDDAESLPREFGRYELQALLGRGGMGAVYRGHDRLLDRAVAIKIPSFGGSAKEVVERFLREARAAASLTHPNICPVFDVGQIDGVHYLSMTLIEGDSLAQRLRDAGPFSDAEAARIASEIAWAMQEAHDRGIIHRDLKPANIMIDRRGKPIVMDFGLARRSSGQSEQRLTRDGAIVGTPAYMPPEQVNGDADIGCGCDIYSLGVILFELSTGRVPFEGPIGTLIAQIVSDRPPVPSALRRDLNPDLDYLCLKALEKSPADRFASMAEFAAALDDFRAGVPTAENDRRRTPTKVSHSKRYAVDSAAIFAEVPKHEGVDRASSKSSPATRTPAEHDVRPVWPWFLGLAVTLGVVVTLVYYFNK